MRGAESNVINTKAATIDINITISIKYYYLIFRSNITIDINIETT